MCAQIWTSVLFTLQPEERQALGPTHRHQLEEERRERLRGFFERRKAAMLKATASSRKLNFFMMVEYPKRV